MREVTVTFRPGVITGLLGRNGAGKSTMLALAAGLRRPTAGSVTASGSPVFEGAVEDIALLGRR
ncbi:MAG: ATP-binding cassette domain-containing protein [Actinomyces sp.]|uniref:ATP-binding cassette domain-containing protein n=1 Tax=Actinomyces sp. TaxID=29317 RepID=UPI0026DC764A|nr:ATP-binding cassette domain-containing protein [Actinomyces sp.]MDO4243134.1 ATP-binding cassette domain-containing protein [Actinomyces sp.]